MIIKKHIRLVIEKMLNVKINTYYASLLYEIINKTTREDITIEDMVLTSVAEHCTLPNSFNTVSNILTIGKGFSEIKTDKRKFLIVMAGSLIPLDNADYPRGFFYNSSLDKIDKIPLWESKIRKSFPLIQSYADSNKVPNKVFNFNQSKNIEFIRNFLNENKIPYHQQICQINSKFYNSLFKEDKNPPKIIFLSLEDIALQFLKILIEKEDSIVETLIFDNFNTTFEELFDVFTCWNNEKGSFLFWYEDNKKLIPLKFYGNYVENQFLKINLTKDEIINLLNTNKLYPSVFVSLLLTNIITNLPTLGGKKQGIYLNKMIDYFNLYGILTTSHEINNVNWGIHPSIAKYLNADLKETSGLFLISNTPNAEQYETYISNEKIIC